MMAFRLVRHIRIINTLGDDAAHSLDLGVLSPNSAVRVTEVGGNDVSVKITEAGTAATATNGFTLKANTSTLLTPDTKPTMGPGEVLLNGTDSSSSNAGDTITLESGVDSTGKTVLFYNRAESNFTLSAINETSGSDAVVRVEEVAHVNFV
jgi:hypothetical protein